MIDKSSLYDKSVPVDAEGNCYAILDLCRIGAAATDTTLSIDVTTSYKSLFECIAALASDVIEQMDGGAA
ncbi:hypothetical protein DL1_11345 [Thioclava dalianensis]|uniref:Uncharacterized protein n=1 Tax=Thioclava dalianensis TaxID=1185766 RepID=A0A074U1J3_9RHOB|nr:hypothetical protein [Thioclava dalianensis]KEP68542.1 hypothetical protein DL1_11345 [Thioclava dalianensis]SFN84434.1 hypothetical protein SAMN05216224_11728 [Thioclava dalianensis]